MALAEGRAPARAALVGNPSDGYGGATLAVTIEELVARVAVEVVDADADAVADGDGNADAISVEPASELIDATLRRFAAEHARGDADRALGALSVGWSTTIPREVGLGGSSAIVVAALRALMKLYDVTIAPPRLAALTLAIETEALGIEAGLQDRVAIAYGGLTFMDFEPEHFGRHGHGRYESLDPGLLPPLFLAYREDSAEQSGAIHGRLRSRFDSGEAHASAAMRELATLTHDARTALADGDHTRFAACVDATFDVRARLLPDLDPRHVEMIAVARDAGASANYTGSGGAIVGCCRDDHHRERVIAALLAAGAAALPVAPSRRRAAASAPQT